MTPPLDSYLPIPADKTSLTDDERIEDVVPLPPPEHLIRFFPIQGTAVEAQVTETRRQVRQILQGRSDRLLVVMGPCSIHDPQAALAYAERLAAQERVLTFAIAAAIGILLLLQAFFRSWRLATVVFVTLPMALVGGALAVLSSAGGLLSLGSIVGLITVLGIAVRNAMTLVSRYRQLEQRDGAPVRPELVERGTRERSGPILMTAVTTALAFLPLALFGDIAGLEIMHPMAVVILGGLVTTTLLSLVGVPAMYLLFGAVREPELEDLSAAVVGEEAMRAAAR